MTPASGEVDITLIRDKINVLILTIRDDEFRAVCDHFPPQASIVNGKNKFYEYSVCNDTFGNSYHVAILRLSGQGNDIAHALTNNAIQDFTLKWIFVVGIAGGVSDDSFTLGDVFIATRYHNFSVRASLEGKQDEWRSGGGPMNPYVESLATNIDIAANQNRLRGWNEDSLIGMSRPTIDVPDSADNDMFYGSPEIRKKTRSTLATHFANLPTTRKQPKVVSGSVFSNNTLLKDTRLAEQWRKCARDAASVEMELSGVMAAVHYSGRGSETVLSIRGISDIVGLKRKGEWTEYACRTAASFARKLVTAGLLEEQTFGSPQHVLKAPDVQIHVDCRWTSPISQYVVALQYLPDDLFFAGVELFSQLLAPLVHFSSELEMRIGSPNSKTLPLQLWDYIHDHLPQRESLPLFGTPGAGKTTLLSLLAVIARRKGRASQPAFDSDYINLHSYDELREATLEQTKVSAVARIESDVSSIRDLAKDRALYLFVDGYDRHIRDKVPLQQSFMERVHDIPGVQVLGVGKPDTTERMLTRIEQINQEVPVTENGCFVSLRSIPLAASELFCERFVLLHAFFRDHGGPRIETTPSALWKRIANSSLLRIDLLRINILASAEADSSLPFTAALDHFIRKTLQDAIHAERKAAQHNSPSLKSGQREVTVDAELQRIARYVYFHDVLEQDDDDMRVSIPCWGALTGHKTTRSFCHAYHIISTLAAIGDRVQAEGHKSSTDSIQAATLLWRSEGLAGKLFPDDTNLHCKWLINHGRADAVLAAITVIVTQHINELSSLRKSKQSGQPRRMTISELAEIAQSIDLTHLCYILGRFDTRKKEAKRLLSRLRKAYLEGIEIEDGSIVDDEEELSRQSSLSKLHMLQCTILISEIRLADKEQGRALSLEYLDRMRHPAWRDMTCGFHLEYYGDSMFHHDITIHLPDQKDTLRPYTRTLDVVERRLTDAIINDAPYGLFDVEMATVCAMAIARQQSTETEWTEDQDACRIRIRRLLSLKLSVNVKRRPVSAFMRMTGRFISFSERTSPFVFVSKLYEMKYDTPRAGWIRKLGLSGRIESVAAHCWGAMLLAEELLPELPSRELANEGYDKSEVIRMLLIHDIAEAVTGDRPSDGRGQHPSGPQRGQEKRVARMLSWVGTLQGISGFSGLASRWDQVEEKSSINGKIAVLFDKLDALYQLTIYRKIYHTQATPEWDAFFEKLRDEVEDTVDGIPWIETMADQWVSWAVEEYESKREWLQHEEMFSGSKKYYPFPDSELTLSAGDRTLPVWNSSVLLPGDKQSDV